MCAQVFMVTCVYNSCLRDVATGVSGLLLRPRAPFLTSVSRLPPYPRLSWETRWGVLPSSGGLPWLLRWSAASSVFPGCCCLAVGGDEGVSLCICVTQVLATGLPGTLIGVITAAITGMAAGAGVCRSGTL